MREKIYFLYSYKAITKDIEYQKQFRDQHSADQYFKRV